MNAGPPTAHPPIVLPPKPEKRRHRPWVLGIVGALTLSVAAACGVPVKPTVAASPSEAATPTSQIATPTSEVATPTTRAATSPQSTPEAVAPATSEAPQFPPQVEQARSSAQNYLSFTAFSRSGLIRQLSSSAGDGYPKDVATQAVDSLDVDWKEQAVKSAENYLSFTSFSCSGLKQQLSSSAGEGFTKEQAAYGASRTAACK
jgi:hypothetical protein